MKKKILLISLLICQHVFSQTVHVYRFDVSGDTPTIEQAREAIQKNKIEGLRLYTADLDAKGKFRSDTRKVLANGNPKKPVGVLIEGSYVEEVQQIRLRYTEGILTANKFKAGKPIRVKPIVLDSTMESIGRFGDSGYLLVMFDDKADPIRTVLLITVKKIQVATNPINASEQVAASDR